MNDIPGFTGSRLDRADRLRSDAAALAAAIADMRARLLRLDGIDPLLGDNGRLVWAEFVAETDRANLLLLGLEDDHPRFVELRDDMPEGGPRSATIFQLLEMLPTEDAATYAAARSLIDWHQRHRFCSRCGQRTTIFRAGWGRQCPNCEAEHFPRVDPVVIMLAEHDGRVLVGRQPRYPAGRYSALAGFLEPGESVEEAVARELHEEAGIRVRDVRYVVSQPWPFPSSLMMACLAKTDDPTLVIDYTELEDAFWVDRTGVEAAMAHAPDAPFQPPPPYAIAHTLFRRWLAGAV